MGNGVSGQGGFITGVGLRGASMHVDERARHNSAMVGAISLVTEVRVFERVDVSDVDAGTRREYVEFVGRVGISPKERMEVEVWGGSFGFWDASGSLH